MTSEDLWELLNLRYQYPEWGLWPQVTVAGTGGARYADGVAMNLFPSRGMEVHGFEIKVDRRDWLRELKAPKKADALARYCDRWWIVVPDDQVVKDGELPPTWGLLRAAGKALRADVQAPKLEAEPPARGFVATLLRRSHDDERWSLQAAAQRATSEAVRKALDDQQIRHDKELAKYVKFEEALGVSVDQFRWHGKSPADVAHTLKRILTDQLTPEERAEKHVRWNLDSLKKAIEEFERQAAGLPAEEDAA